MPNGHESDTSCTMTNPVTKQYIDFWIKLQDSKWKDIGMI